MVVRYALSSELLAEVDIDDKSLIFYTPKESIKFKEDGIDTEIMVDGKLCSDKREKGASFSYSSKDFLQQYVKFFERIPFLLLSLLEDEKKMDVVADILNKISEFEGSE